MRVGEKEISEQAEIVKRYADLFSASSWTLCARPRRRRAATSASCSTGCARPARAGSCRPQLVEREDELENRLLATRVTFQGEEMPLRNAQAKLAVLTAYADREELGEIQADASAAFNPDRLELIAAAEELSADLSGIADPVERNEEEKAISLRELSRGAAARRATRRRALRGSCASAGSSGCSAPSATTSRRATTPPTCAGSRRSSRRTRRSARPRSACDADALGFDLAARPNIKLDLDDRPQKAPRACVIASDPPSVVHLITRAQGGLHDYQAFLHEAGHALHYGGCRPGAALHVPPHLARPRADGDLLVHRRGDLARARVARALLRPLAEQARENAEATTFLEALLFRRYEAKLRYELDFWARFSDDGGDAEGYERAPDRGDRRPLPPATPTSSDMDAGFYSADYLRAWIRSAQLRESPASRGRRRLVAHPATGDLLRELFREGTKPSSEEIAARLGFDPLDTAPLLHEIGA